LRYRFTYLLLALIVFSGPTISLALEQLPPPRDKRADLTYAFVSGNRVLASFPKPENIFLVSPLLRPDAPTPNLFTTSQQLIHHYEQISLLQQHMQTGILSRVGHIENSIRQLQDSLYELKDLPTADIKALEKAELRASQLTPKKPLIITESLECELNTPFGGTFVATGNIDEEVRLKEQVIASCLDVEVGSEYWCQSEKIRCEQSKVTIDPNIEEDTSTEPAVNEVPKLETIPDNVSDDSPYDLPSEEEDLDSIFDDIMNLD